MIQKVIQYLHVYPNKWKILIQIHFEWQQWHCSSHFIISFKELIQDLSYSSRSLDLHQVHVVPFCSFGSFVTYFIRRKAFLYPPSFSSANIFFADSPYDISRSTVSGFWNTQFHGNERFSNILIFRVLFWDTTLPQPCFLLPAFLYKVLRYATQTSLRCALRYFL